MITPKEKANELISVFGKTLAIKCCNEVLGFMGADRGHEYWSEVLRLIKTLRTSMKDIHCTNEVKMREIN